MGDLVFGTEACHLFAGEVRSVVEDDGTREPKVTYDVLPEEFDNLLSRDVRVWHRFHPFGEIICSY